jgi:hypothetical protein
MTESGLSREVAAAFLSKGIAGRDISSEDLRSLKLIVCLRKGNDIGVVPVIRKEDAPEKNLMPNFDIITALEKAKMKSFDDMYIVNFVQIQNEIDAKVKELKK